MIVLINPPLLYSPTQETAGVVPPIGLAYIAAALSEEDYDVSIIDAVGEKFWQNYPWEKNRLRGLTFDEIIEKIPPDTRWIGISNLYTFSFLIAASLSKAIRSKYPNIPIVFGGAHSTMMPEYTLNHSAIDAVVLSEGEIAAVQYTKALNGEYNFEDIDGFAYRKNGEIIINPKTTFIKDLDTVPFPRRDLLPMENYFIAREPHGSASELKWTTIIGSRGCPYACTFCNTPSIWKRRWRIRSPQNVVDEIKTLIAEYDMQELHFEDENLCQNRKWVIEFCDLMIKENIKIKWQPSNGIRAESVTDETIAKMKASGCTHVTIAAESGSPEVLEKIINKNLDLKAVIEAVRIIHKYRLKSAVYFMLGLPGEKKRDVLMSIKLAGKLARMGASEVTFSIFSPLPGSELTEKLVKDGRVNITEDFFSQVTPHGDMLNADSYSEYITGGQVLLLKYSGYAWFYLNRMFFHPLSFLSTFLNIYRNVQTTKTERVLGTMFHRIMGKDRESDRLEQIKRGESKVEENVI